MSNLINAVKSQALGVAEYFTPVLKESRFAETGVITPEEFVAAGDHLVHHCPTWQWSGGDTARRKTYLPDEKQFLVTRNVPCYRRVKHIDYNVDQEKILEGAEDGWVDTHHYAVSSGSGQGVQVAEEMVEAEQTPLGSGSGTGDTQMDAEDEDDEAAIDMEAFADPGMLDQDDAHVVDSAQTDKQTDQQTGSSGDDNVIQTRTYDLNITYDKYYQTPRMWLQGFDERRKILGVEAMYEDFSQDHVNKTITVEAHPHIPGPSMASIHPCRHADVMKKLIETLADSGKQLHVHQYLLVFLKFVQAVIPTIEYDYTQNVQL